MTQITANGISIEYDTFGSEQHEPLLLVMGLGAQMTLWREEFCGLLADRAASWLGSDRPHHLSTHLEELGTHGRSQAPGIS